MKSIRWRAISKAHTKMWKYNHPLSFIEKLQYVNEGGNINDLETMKKWKANK